jgi:DNA repair protein RadC
MLAVRELPLDSQPEHRAKTLGYGSLSNYELLQLVYSFKSLETTQQLAAQAGSLRNLATMSLEEMQTIEGIGPKAALAIKAALEIGRRMAVEEREDESSLRSPDDFFKRLSYLQWMEQEHMVVVLLNSKLKVIAIETPHVGTVDSCQVRISEMFKMAVRRNATQVLLAHNHPSGDPEPSPQDVAITAQAIEAGKLLDIPVLDHIIIGHNRYVSLRARSLCSFT